MAEINTEAAKCSSKQQILACFLLSKQQILACFLLSKHQFLACFLLLLPTAMPLTDPADLAALQSILKGVGNPNVLAWSGNDPCGSGWAHIGCQGSSVTAIFAANLQLRGTLSPDLSKLLNLKTLQLQNNGFTGPLPSLQGLAFLTDVLLVGNSFDTIPADFFSGLTSLQHIFLDDNPLNSSQGWSLPQDVQGLAQLQTLSLTNTSLVGEIPSFLAAMPALKVLNMAYNRLSGGIPSGFSSSNLIQLQLNNQQGPVLSGPIDPVGGMQSLHQLWLQVNQFSGPIPKGLINSVSLQDLRLNDNQLVGVIPPDVAGLPLTNFTVENNQLCGSIPPFGSNVVFVFSGNNFCQPSPGIACAPEVSALLDFLAGVNYPSEVDSSWKGNDPCSGWTGVTCDPTTGKVTVLQLSGFKLNGTISPSLANLTSLVALKLSNNHLSGTIPKELTLLPSIKAIDLSNNDLSKPVPVFSNQVALDISGNPLGDSPPSLSSPPGTSSSPSSSASGNGSSSSGNALPPASHSSHSTSSTPVGVIIGSVLGCVGFLLLVAAAVLLVLHRRKKRSRFLRVQSPNTVVVHPRDSGSHPEVVKIVVADGSANENASEVHNSEPSEVQVVEAGNLFISIQVLRQATNNFSPDSVLGRGGFGVVYRGALDDGTNIAVKRMEAAAVSSKGLKEFQSEIAVLSQVRHRHLVGLLGYCIEGSERMLVYEYMPQGALSQHLFEYAKLEMKPLNWKQRLLIALDVARGMEYLHSLAQQSFIHRDLKPSNILLGDDFHAKVSDFGLVKLSEGKHSMETRLAGTFGYLAPEYAATGRVSTKVDVFSFGVVLMELITGRRALDETQSEENMHLVAYFRRMNARKETFRSITDPAIELTDDSFMSISTMAELAGHCTARESYQRPDMGHAVNVLAPLVELWKPTDYDLEETAGIDFDMTLPQALKRWQALENPSSSCLNDSQTSIPTLPSGFAESFTSADGR